MANTLSNALAMLASSVVLMTPSLLTTKLTETNVFNTDTYMGKEDDDDDIKR